MMATEWKSTGPAHDRTYERFFIMDDFGLWGPMDCETSQRLRGIQYRLRLEPSTLVCSRDTLSAERAAQARPIKEHPVY